MCVFLVNGTVKRAIIHFSHTHTHTHTHTQNESVITCVYLSEVFLVYGTVKGAIVHFHLSEWMIVNEYRFACYY